MSLLHAHALVAPSAKFGRRNFLFHVDRLAHCYHLCGLVPKTTKLFGAHLLLALIHEHLGSAESNLMENFPLFCL